MVHRNQVEGRIYSFKSKSLCDKEGIAFPNIPKVVRRHMVLALDWVPGKRGYVRVMTITSTIYSNGEYLPISPTKKKPYPIQLKLQNGPDRIARLPQWNSYLKIDTEYEVPINVLQQAIDNTGHEYMLWLYRHGSIHHLRDYLRKRANRQANDSITPPQNVLFEDFFLLGEDAQAENLQFPNASSSSEPVEASEPENSNATIDQAKQFEPAITELVEASESETEVGSMTLPLVMTVLWTVFALLYVLLSSIFFILKLASLDFIRLWDRANRAKSMAEELVEELVIEGANPAVYEGGYGE